MAARAHRPAVKRVQKTSGPFRVDAPTLMPEERNLIAEWLDSPPDGGPQDPLLRRSAQALELVVPGMRPWCVDFRTAQWRARLRGPRAPLVRAIGQATQVIDATAGFGRDAFVLAAAGHDVLAIERHPVVALLLFDGLARACSDRELAPVAARVSWQLGDAKGLLAVYAMLPETDVVYLDPMFTEPGRAEVRKEAQLLRLLVPPDPDPVALFAAARDAGARRIVVKRQAKQPPLIPDPTGSVRATRVRFDYYVR